jgi:hypothetical protein
MPKEPPEYLTKLNKEFPEEYIPLARAACDPLILRESLGKGRKRYFCTHCNESYEFEAFHDDPSWRLWAAHHNDEAECLKCGRIGKVIDGKRWVLERHWNYAPLVVRVQLKEKRQAILCFDLARALGYNEIYGFFQHIEASLDDIYLLDEGCAAHYKYYGYFKRYYRYKYKDSVSEEFRDGFGEPFSNHVHTTGTMFYKVHDVGRWDYSRDILKYMPVGMKAKAFAPCASMAAFACYPALEMIYKSGFEDIVNNVIKGKKCVKICNIKGRSFKEVFPKFTRQEIKSFNTAAKRDVKYLELYADIKKKYGGDTQYIGVICDFIGLFYGSRDVLKNLLGVPFMPHKAIRYFNKQVEGFIVSNKAPAWACLYGTNTPRITKVYDHWLDYIKAARAIGFDLTREDVAFPKDLGERHDMAVKLHRDILAERQVEELKSLWENNEKMYGYSDGEFVIVNPRTTYEIIDEGKAQGHCVAGYADRHAKGTLAIVFIRKVGEEDKAFLTVEMHKDHMQQIQGKRNRYQMSDHEKEFVDKWLKVVKERFDPPKKKTIKRKEKTALAVGTNA